MRSGQPIAPGSPAARPLRDSSSARVESSGWPLLPTRMPRNAGLAWVGWSFILIFVALSLAVFANQQLDFEQAAAVGMVVSDVVNLAQTLDNLWATGGFDQDANQFIGISYLYGWTWSVHPSLCFLINAFLMSASIVLYTRGVITQSGAPGWSILGVVGNPYLILAMPGPNKEIPLLFLTMLLFVMMLRRRRGWTIGATLVCGLIFTFRDGYGAFMLATVATMLVLGARERYFAPLLCAAFAVVATLFGALASIIPIFARNVANFEVISVESVAIGAFASLLGLDLLSPMGGAVLYFLRLIYNLVSLALFPVLTTVENDYYWIGVSYWLFGIMILSAMPACIVTTVKNRVFPRPLMLMGGFVVTAWFMISVSLFVQPRYLMPVLPFAVGLLSMVSVKFRRNCVTGSLLLVFCVLGLYTILGRSPPSVDTENIDAPAYIWAR